MGKIGVIGCGLMGTGIISRLTNYDDQVVVYDINDEAVDYVVTLGAQKAINIRKIAESVDIVILSLPSAALIEEVVLLGEDSLLKTMKKETIIIDMSTNDVELTKRLYEEAKKKQIHFFDCPLSGGPAGAHEGTLTMMIGGDEIQYERIKPLLQKLGKHVHFMGPAGSGQIVKLCNNMLVAGIISLLSEVLSVGEKAGLSKDKLAPLFQQGSGQTRVMDVFGPNMLKESYEEVIFSLPNMMKDLFLYESLAKEYSQLPISKPIIHLFEEVANLAESHLDVTIVDKYIN